MVYNGLKSLQMVPNGHSNSSKLLHVVRIGGMSWWVYAKIMVRGCKEWTKTGWGSKIGVGRNYGGEVI